MKENNLIQPTYVMVKKFLKEAGIDSPAFDAAKIISHCTGIDRQRMIMYPEKKITKEQFEKIKDKMVLRAKGVPLQYILGEWEFMGRVFEVGEGVLIPRDDTEVLVNEAVLFLKEIYQKRPIKVLELCAGSGIVSITLGKMFPNLQICALEVSDEACSFFMRNVEKHNVKNVELKKYDIRSGPEIEWISNFDLLVSNPPYIPDAEVELLQKEVQYEPKLALCGGNDGLDFYRLIAQKWMQVLKNKGKAFFEIGIGQSLDVSDIFLEKGYEQISVTKDVNYIDRVIGVFL